MCPEFSAETMVDISKAKCPWPKISTFLNDKTGPWIVVEKFVMCCILRTHRLCLIFPVFLVENINQDTVSLEFRNLSDVMDHHADRNSDKNAVSYGDPERKSRARMPK